MKLSRGEVFTAQPKPFRPPHSLQTAYRGKKPLHPVGGGAQFAILLLYQLRLALELDLDVHACGEVETHEAVDRRGGGVKDVDEALVGAHLELLAGVLVLVR